MAGTNAGKYRRHAIVVDAKNERAISFYESLGFVVFPGQSLRLFLLCAVARAAQKQLSRTPAGGAHTRRLTGPPLLAFEREFSPRPSIPVDSPNASLWLLAAHAPRLLAWRARERATLATLRRHRITDQFEPRNAASAHRQMTKIP